MDVMPPPAAHEPDAAAGHGAVPGLTRRRWLMLATALLLGGCTGEAAGDALLEAFAAQRSDVMMTVSGTVQRTLRDDLKGSRHQRFILAHASGHTVLVAHNIDLAPRIDALREGDAVTVRGEYEWNRKGGVLHWTHHDPKGRHEGGWIEHRGQRYQ